MRIFRAAFAAAFVQPRIRHDEKKNNEAEQQHQEKLGFVFPNLLKAFG
jgi:hypothetical protein